MNGGSTQFPSLQEARAYRKQTVNPLYSAGAGSSKKLNKFKTAERVFFFFPLRIVTNFQRGLFWTELIQGAL